MPLYSPAAQTLRRLQFQSKEQISAAENELAAELEEKQKLGRLQKNEWLMSLFGSDDIERVYPAAAVVMGHVEAIRHQLGEPFMYRNSMRGLLRDVGVIARPDSYNPRIPESFLTFTVDRGDYSWIGEVSCRVFVDTLVDEHRSKGYKPTEEQQLTVLSIERRFTDILPHQIEDYTDGTEAGCLIGLAAISQFSDANPREAHNMWPRRLAEERLRSIYAIAGELVMTPPVIAAAD